MKLIGYHASSSAMDGTQQAKEKVRASGNCNDLAGHLKICVTPSNHSTTFSFLNFLKIYLARLCKAVIKLYNLNMNIGTLSFWYENFILIRITTESILRLPPKHASKIYHINPAILWFSINICIKNPVTINGML